MTVKLREVSVHALPEESVVKLPFAVGVCTTVAPVIVVPPGASVVYDVAPLKFRVYAVPAQAVHEPDAEVTDGPGLGAILITCEKVPNEIVVLVANASA